MMVLTCDGSLDITLRLEDKEAGERFKRLEAIAQGGNEPLVVMHIVYKVRSHELMEDPGFHISAKPRGEGPENRKRYDIYLSSQRFHDLTNPSSPIVEGGYFGTRCRFDRVDIKYFGV